MKYDLNTREQIRCLHQNYYRDVPTKHQRKNEVNDFYLLLGLYKQVFTGLMRQNN